MGDDANESLATPIGIKEYNGQVRLEVASIYHYDNAALIAYAK
jgi:hypothetical protein